jgi:hypothetical protein
LKEPAVLVVPYSAALHRDAEHIAYAIRNLSGIQVVLANLSDSDLGEFDREVDIQKVCALSGVRQPAKQDLV